MTLVPEIMREGLRKAGFSKRAANNLSTLAQLGIIAYLAPSYTPIIAGVGLSAGMNALGADPTLSSALGNTAATAVTLFQGTEVTPKILAVSMGGSLVGSTLVIHAKSKLKCWLGYEDEGLPTSHTKPHEQVASPLSYLQDYFVLGMWIALVMTVLWNDTH